MRFHSSPREVPVAANSSLAGIEQIGSNSTKANMAIQFNEENSGKLVIIKVSGKLAKVDYEQFQPKFERLVRQHGKISVMFVMTDFHGWEASALWSDIKFDLKHFSDIQRLAIVGDKKWQEGMAAFCKPFTRATIQYFDHAQATEARKWVAAAESSEAAKMNEHSSRGTTPIPS